MARTYADLAERLAAREAAGLYRRRRVVDVATAPLVRVDGRELLAFCSNDYLGLANDPRVIAAFCEGARRYGVGSGASHLVCGHTPAHHALEEELARFTGRERALLFGSGYAANLGVAAALLARGDVALQDRLNHASLLDGALLSGARPQRFRHNDVEDLERRLARVQGLRGTPAPAAATLRRALERLQKAPAAPVADRIACLQDLGVRAREAGDGAGALAAVREAMALVTDDAANAEATRLLLLDLLVKAAGVAGDHTAVLEGATARVELLARISGPEHADLVLPLKQSASALHALGRDGEAIPRIQRWIAIVETIRGADTPGIAEGLDDLSQRQIAVGALDDADATIARWTRIVRRVTAEHPSLVDAGERAAQVLVLRGRHADAADRLEETLQHALHSMSDKPQRLGQVALALARACRAAGRMDRAREALAAASKYYGARGEVSIDGMLVAVESAQIALVDGKASEAKATLEASIAGLEQRFGAEHRVLVEPLELLARAYRVLDRPADAEAAEKRARAIGAGR